MKAHEAVRTAAGTTGIWSFAFGALTLGFFVFIATQGDLGAWLKLFFYTPPSNSKAAPPVGAGQASAKDPEQGVKNAVANTPLGLGGVMKPLWQGVAGIDSAFAPNSVKDAPSNPNPASPDGSQNPALTPSIFSVIGNLFKGKSK